MDKQKILPYVLLHGLLLIYSLGSVCSKMAGRSEFLSFMFLLFYGLTLFILVVYAVAWQQLLRKLPLITAYANRSVTLIWGLLWGALIFKETITVWNVIGALVIISGIYLVVSADGE